MKVVYHDVPFNDCCRLIDMILDIIMVQDYDEITYDEIATLLQKEGRILDRE